MLSPQLNGYGFSRKPPKLEYNRFLLVFLIFGSGGYAKISGVLLSVCSICNVSHRICMDAHVVAIKQDAATMLLAAKWHLGQLLHVYSTRLKAQVFTYVTCRH